MYSHPDPLKVIGWMAQLATPMFSISLSTWTWDTLLTPGGSQGFYRDHVLPPRPSKSYRVDGTAGFIVAQPAIWWHSRLYGGWHSRLYGGTAGYMVVAHEILVSAQGPLVLGFRFRGLGPGLDNKNCTIQQFYFYGKTSTTAFDCWQSFDKRQ